MDPCAVHPDCGSCVHDEVHKCGWCSTRVVYQSGFTGGHCASNNGDNPFVCYSVYSTQDCQPGWKCHKGEKKCYPTPPGTGTNKYACYEECGELPPPPPGPSGGPTYICNARNFTCEKPPNGVHGHNLETCKLLCKKAPPATPSAPVTPANVYKCNEKTFKCEPVKAGTPGSTSFPVCKGFCYKHKNYTCDYKNYKCVENKMGKGTHLADCEESCVKLYHCHTSDYECKIAPFPAPGVPLGKCKAECHPSHHTPSALSGMWRGLQINLGFQKGEWDIEFANGTVTLVGPGGRYLEGNTTFLGTPTRRIVRITVQHSTIHAYPVHSFLEFWYAYDGSSPETRFLMMAAGPKNHYAPGSWKKATSSRGGMEFAMMACEPLRHCKFHVRPRTTVAEDLNEEEMKPEARFRAMSILEAAEDEEDDMHPEATMVGAVDAKIKDPCMKWHACGTCLAHKYCGWCSVPVVYSNGQHGGRCAGIPGENGNRNQFKCYGIYRTSDCSDYECVQPQGKCIKVPLGSGTNQSECHVHCHPHHPPPGAPSPPPPRPPAEPAIWVCNHTNSRCQPAKPGQSGGTSRFICQNICGTPPAIPSTPTAPVPPIPPATIAPVYICNEKYRCQRAKPGVPGATSHTICKAQCSAPPPPPAHIEGHYRGLQIDNTYKPGEYDFILANGTFVLKLSGRTVASGMVQLEAKLGALLFKIQKPIDLTVAAIYSENSGIEVNYLTLVLGNDAQTVPTGWDLPWIKGGSHGREYVFIKVR
eukprot:TRINITY_DN55961_c0_g2_i1.p1 TRINITY_DN55961_c0_g2~~TRINITY_DN55961_c0_g2_i1.p1  ORF type:complete len:787 (-),score=129.14 TRINITY_DN55961_c0_g2_i1:288-2555(-)